jgi:polar amino acid transport system substrate-binding protein
MTASDWPPYVDANMDKKGFAVVLVTEALKRAGYSTSLTIEPWPMALEATQNGSYDVDCALWFTEERATTLAFSKPYVENPIIFIKRSESDFEFRDRSDLSGLKVGIVHDFAYREQAYDTTGIELVEGDSVRENIRRLLAGDIDLVVADGRVALNEANQIQAAENITIIRQPLSTRGLRIAVSKSRADHSEIIAKFDQAIASMKDDGTFNTILATYRINY